MNGICRIGLFLFCVMCGTFGIVHAQNVSNVTAEQVGNTIHVTYDLDKAADISLFVSMDGGGTYSKLYRVSGDVGKTVGPGHKLIVWDVLSEVEELESDNIVFKVRVDANAVAAWRKQLRALDKENEEDTVKEPKEPREQKRETKEMPYSTFFTLNGSYSPMPQWACGFKVGGMKRVGWFVSVMSNFQFKGMYQPFWEGQMYPLTGKTRGIRFSAQAGLVVRPCKPMSLLFGVGYGYRTLAFQTTGKEWYSYPQRTYNGIDASFGLLFDIKKFALSAEVVSTNFKTIEARIGVGFCLPHNNSPQGKTNHNPKH